MTGSRAEIQARLRATSFDLVVVGGGITGAGIARDAALRGLSVAVVEKGDLARGTSSASSKLIHGGLRYLEQLELALVREGVRERALLMKNAPHLARPLPFLFPIFKGSRVGPFQVNAGMWLYDALALFGNYKRHRMLGAREVKRVEPWLRATGLRAGTVYYDCLTDDARLTTETAVDAAERGAVIATHHEVVSFVRDGERVTGVVLRDRLAPADLGDDLGATDGVGQTFEVRSKLVVSATGPWTDRLLGLARPAKPMLRPTKGVHIVLDRARLPLAHAIVLTAVRDGRVLFAIPWGPRTVIGTTDTDDEQGPETTNADARDIEYLLETANHYFPKLRATEADIFSTWSGLRPLIAAGAVKESQVSREHEIFDVVPGMIAIAGGKLTTYRLMAEQVVDRAVEKLGKKVEPCRTEVTPLPGAAGDLKAIQDPAAYGARLERELGLPKDVALHLAQAYGLRAKEVLELANSAPLAGGHRPDDRLVADLPFVYAEVRWAIRRELAQRLDDVLRRRTLVFLRDRDQGLACAEPVARVMAQELGWDAARVKLELDRYRALVERSRDFRTSTPRSGASQQPARAR